ncbi:MAG TPA: histidine kinase [Thermoanaerobaculia bacterium]|nr:histidine kinase [Thermoanaerobaculia bacterium]
MNPGALQGLVIGLVLAFPLSDAPEPRQSGKVIGTGATAPTIALTAPTGGWTVDRMVLVAGTVSDPTINPVTVSINGDRYLLKTVNGAFQRKFPASSGKNTVVVQGTNKGGTGRAERTVYAQVPSVPVFLVLTSDTDGVYTDLHVYEPPPDAPDPETAGRDATQHVFWARTSSPSGGTFYLNEQGGDFDSPGYGPYLYTHASPPLGFTRVDVNYWPSGDKAQTVATLNIVLFGGTSNEIRRRVKLPLIKPGETQTLAWIKIEKGRRAHVWLPTLEKKPADTKTWPAWVTEFKRKAGPDDPPEPSDDAPGESN